MFSHPSHDPHIRRAGLVQTGADHAALAPQNLHNRHAATFNRTSAPRRFISPAVTTEIQTNQKMNISSKSAHSLKLLRDYKRDVMEKNRQDLIQAH